jgi:transposase-like protein
MKKSNKGGKPSAFENSFKIMIAREYLCSNLGYGTLAKKYGLSGPTTVVYFVKWYKSNYAEVQEVQLADESENKTDSSTEVEELRKQLQLANLKVAGWELLMENAHKELGIDIVKKYGTKQSDK